jgi:predicted nucleotidyltransferase
LRASKSYGRYGTTMIQIPQDFREFIRLLNENDVEYLVVGGYAVAFHGYVRYTCDIDFFIAVNKDTADGMVCVLKQFGFPPGEISPDLFLKKDQVLRMGVEPMRLEILNRIDGVEFDVCYEHRQVLDVDGLQINFIGLNDLIENKKATPRSKDKLDVIELERGREG